MTDGHDLTLMMRRSSGRGIEEMVHDLSILGLPAATKRPRRGNSSGDNRQLVNLYRIIVGIRHSDEPSTRLGCSTAHTHVATDRNRCTVRACLEQSPDDEIRGQAFADSAWIETQPDR